MQGFILQNHYYFRTFKVLIINKSEKMIKQYYGTADGFLFLLFSIFVGNIIFFDYKIF